MQVNLIFFSASTLERFANSKVVWVQEQEIAAKRLGN